MLMLIIRLWKVHDNKPQNVFTYIQLVIRKKKILGFYQLQHMYIILLILSHHVIYE